MAFFLTISLENFNRQEDSELLAHMLCPEFPKIRLSFIAAAFLRRQYKHWAGVRMYFIALRDRTEIPMESIISIW